MPRYRIGSLRQCAMPIFWAPGRIGDPPGCSDAAAASAPHVLRVDAAGGSCGAAITSGPQNLIVAECAVKVLRNDKHLQRLVRSQSGCTTRTYQYARRLVWLDNQKTSVSNRRISNLIYCEVTKKGNSSVIVTFNDGCQNPVTTSSSITAPVR
jgi:hypothetical protein